MRLSCMWLNYPGFSINFENQFCGLIPTEASHLELAARYQTRSKSFI